MVHALEEVRAALNAGPPDEAGADSARRPEGSQAVGEGSVDALDIPIRVDTLDAVLSLKKSLLRALLVHMRSLSGRFDEQERRAVAGAPARPGDERPPSGSNPSTDDTG